MTTYTVVNQYSGDVIDTGCTAVEAMNLMLTYDGYAYEIRREADGKSWRLWHSDGSANSTRSARHMVGTLIWSFADDESAATQEIAEAVIAAGWPRTPNTYTDEAYEAMQAQLAADEALVHTSGRH